MNTVLFIIVIYRIHREESSAYLKMHALLPADTKAIYVHDNTEKNIYLAAAYNQGLAYAVANGFKYIVLLDADASPTEEYLSAVQQAISSGEQHAFWAPNLVSAKGLKLSPSVHWGIPIALNSGLLLPVTLLQEIGGFNTDYPLDYLDCWLCYQLQQRHIPLHTLPVTLLHDLSVTDYSRVPRERYLSLLSGEKRFAKETGHVWRYRFRLIGRLIKWSFTRHPYVQETWKAFVEL